MQTNESTPPGTHRRKIKDFVVGAYAFVTGSNVYKQKGLSLETVENFIK